MKRSLEATPRPIHVACVVVTCDCAPPVSKSLQELTPYSSGLRRGSAAAPALCRGGKPVCPRSLVDELRSTHWSDGNGSGGKRGISAAQEFALVIGRNHGRAELARCRKAMQRFQFFCLQGCADVIHPVLLWGAAWGDTDHVTHDGGTMKSDGSAIARRVFSTHFPRPDHRSNSRVRRAVEINAAGIECSGGAASDPSPPPRFFQR